MRRLRPLIWAGLAIALSLLGYIILLPGTLVCGVSVGGLTVAGAARRLEQTLEWETRRVTLTGNGKDMEVSLAGDLGLTLDYVSSIEQCRRPLWSAFQRRYPLLARSESGLLSSLASEISSRFTQQVSDARYSFAGEEVVVIPEVLGWAPDIPQFLKFFSFEAGLPEMPSVLEIPGIETLPAVYASELETYLPFERVSQFRTYYADGNARSRNIVLSCAPLSEVTIGPGETFSFNRSVGPRTPDRGYLKAPVFVGDETVDDYGGGVCQVSTTLYISMLKAGFAIAERYCHAKPVDYVPLGFDATVAYDYLDLRMTNPGDAPCLIRVIARKGELVAEVFGRPASDLSIEVESHVLKEMPAEVVEQQLEPSSPPAAEPEKPKLRSGYLVETVRKWVRGGRLERVERLNTSMYPAEKPK